MSVIRQRKKYFIKPGFQSRLTAIMILLVIIVANLVGALTYFFAYEQFEALIRQNQLLDDLVTATKGLLPGVLISELISIFVVGFLCIKITHTIAGPVYRMERVARGIGEGDLTNFIKLRQKDELKDLADSMNEMTMGLRNRIISLNESLAEVREELEAVKNSKDLSKIDSSLQKLNCLEETLKTFILEKEKSVRQEVEDEEESEEKESEETNKTEDKKEEADKKEVNEEKPEEENTKKE